MLRITKISDYGFVLLIHMARSPWQTLFTARDLTAETGLTLPMVSKILKALARGGLLESHRGTKGGYSLIRRPDRITATEILSALEGPISITECAVPEDSHCSIEMLCPVKASWRRINRAIVGALDGLTLDEMAHPEEIESTTGNGSRATTPTEATTH